MDPPDILEALVAAGARVERFEEILVTMEQVFLQVARGEGHPLPNPAASPDLGAPA